MQPYCFSDQWPLSVVYPLMVCVCLFCVQAVSLNNDASCFTAVQWPHLLSLHHFSDQNRPTQMADTHYKQYFLYNMRSEEEIRLLGLYPYGSQMWLGCENIFVLLDKLLSYVNISTPQYHFPLSICVCSL